MKVCVCMYPRRYRFPCRYRCVSDTRIQSRVHACACEGSFSKLRHGPLPKLPPLAVSPPTQLSHKHTSFVGGPTFGHRARAAVAGAADPVVRLFCLRHALPSLSPPPSPQSVAAASLRSSCPNFRRAFPRPIFPLPSLHTHVHCTSGAHCTPFLPAPSCSLRFVCRQ